LARAPVCISSQKRLTSSILPSTMGVAKTISSAIPVTPFFRPAGHTAHETSVAYLRVNDYQKKDVSQTSKPSYVPV
jgi:hypothetical protein